MLSLACLPVMDKTSFFAVAQERKVGRMAADRFTSNLCEIQASDEDHAYIRITDHDRLDL